VDSVAASLAAAGGWLRDGAKLAVLGVLGLGLVPLLVGAFMELAVLPLRCICAHEQLRQWPSTSKEPFMMLPGPRHTCNQVNR